MPKPSIEKIFKEIDKGTLAEQYDLYTQVKDHVQKNILAGQKKKEDEATELQSKAEKLSH